MIRHAVGLSIVLFVLAFPAAVRAHIEDAPNNGPSGGGSSGPAGGALPAPPPGTGANMPSGGGNNSNLPQVRQPEIKQPPVPIAKTLGAKDPKDRVRGLGRTLEDLMQAMDPDLKTKSGELPSAESRTKHFRYKLSAPQEVLSALETQSKLNAGQEPTAAELERAEKTLLTAINDLRDDAPSEISSAIFTDPYWSRIYRALVVLGILAVVAFGVKKVYDHRAAAA